MHQCFTVLLAADFADDMDNRLVDVEVCVDAVMLEHDDVRVLRCNDAGETLKRAGNIRHDDGELHVAAAGDETLFDDAVDEAHINVAAGQQADNLFAAEVIFAGQQCGEGRGTCRLDNLLGALEQQQDGGCNVIIRYSNHVIDKGIDVFHRFRARALDRNAVGNRVDGFGRMDAVLME